MKNKYGIIYILSICLVAVVFYFVPSNATEHDKKEEKEQHENHEEGHGKEDEHEKEHGSSAEHDDHGKEEEHGHEEKHGEEEVSASVGPDSAITEAHETRGIKLSPEAVKRLRLKTQTLQSKIGSQFEIEKDAFIGERGKSFVYALRDGWYQLIPVTYLSKTSNLVKIQSPNLKSGEVYVTTGASLVRLAHLEAFGASGDGHGH